MNTINWSRVPGIFPTGNFDEARFMALKKRYTNTYTATLDIHLTKFEKIISKHPIYIQNRKSRFSVLYFHDNDLILSEVQHIVVGLQCLQFAVLILSTESSDVLP